MEIFTDVRGKPGLDCGGFCEFCFYKGVDFNKLKSFGCIKCPPNQIGCEYCQGLIDRVKYEFKPLYNVLIDLEKKLMHQELLGLSNYNNLKIIVSGGADILYYPHLKELISVIKESELHLHLGYTSGKAIKSETMAEDLILNGVDELSFSVFSTDPEMRSKWMNDQTPDESINGLKMFCENIDVNASAIIIPEINDEKKIFQTCSDLEEWGIKSLTLRRFANYKDQGLIFNNKAILDGIKFQSYEKYQDLVRKVSNEFSFKVVSYPFYDYKKDFPFAISKIKNRKYLKKLPTIESETTIITSKLAEPYLKKIFGIIDQLNRINIISVNKDIADLITEDDLKFVNLKELRQKVIIPRGALVHDKQVKKIFCCDGVDRKIVRGPQVLTHPYFERIEFNQEELINYELKSFKDLIDKINL